MGGRDEEWYVNWGNRKSDFGYNRIGERNMWPSTIS